MNTTIAEKLKGNYLFLLPLVLGLILRLIHAGQRSFRFDEGLIARLVQEDVVGVIVASSQNSTPYIFNLLVHAFYKFFGPSEFVLLLIPIIGGTILIYVVYVFCDRYFSRTIALTASLITAISPFLIFFSQNLRPYSLLCAFSFTGAYFFLRALETNKIVYWGLTMLFNIMSVFTQPIGWLFIFVQTAYFVIYFKSYKRSLFHWLITTVFTGLYYLPQRAFNQMLVELMGWHLIRPTGIIDFFSYTIRRFFGTIFHFTSGYYFFDISLENLMNPVDAIIFLIMMLTPITLMVLGFIYMLKKGNRLHIYLLMLCFAPLGLILMDGTFPRYYIMATAPFIIVFAFGLEYIKPRLRIILWTGLLFSAGLALGNSYTLPNSTFSPENPRDVSKMVNSLKQPGDIIYYMGGINASHTWKYYNPDATDIIYGTAFWQEHYYGIHLNYHPDEYLKPHNFAVRVDPLLEKYNRVLFVMTGSRHRTIKRMVNSLKQYYDIDLIYNKNWNSVAIVKKLPAKLETSLSDSSAVSN